MFSSSSNPSELSSYDFLAEENAQKWRGLFTKSLQKVQRQVHPNLFARDEALEYIENLILQLLGMLCASQPHSVQDVEDRVQKTFPHPIDKWAQGDAQNALEKGKKKSPLVLPVDKIHPLLTREVLGYKVDHHVTVYIVAVLEYIAADILKLTGNYVRNIKHPDITLQDIKVAMCADKVLMDMFFQYEEDDFMVEEGGTMVRRGSLTYEEIVKDLILEETQYLRDLNLIIRVFRAPFATLFPKSKDLDVIFSNILEVYELTGKLLSLLEDTLEVTDEDGLPLVGACFEEVVESAEFEVYEKYADDILKPNCRDRLNALIQRNDTLRTLQSKGGRGFKDAVKYVLPKLLLGPIYHFLHYFEVIKALISTSIDEEDKECLETARGVINIIKIEIEKKLTSANIMKRKGDTTLRFQGRAEREAALNKMNEIQKSIDGWEGKNIGQSCNELIMEGTLCKYAGRRFTERYVLLFDGLIVLTKQNTRRGSVTGPVGEYKLKEKFNIRKIDIVDREDTEELKHAFELVVPNQASIILQTKNADEKNNWMASLVSLHMRSNLERILDSALKEEEKQHPLKPLEPSVYRFAEKDSDENIVFEENQDPSTENRLIKGGTLLKLIERLTYHAYADPKFVRTFLTTYRTFTKPEELLSLLIERFEIPDPEIDLENVDVQEKEMRIREDLKRFRKEYTKPVQFRVLNVIRQWIDQHWYDFEQNEDLLNKLTTFLECVRGKAMRKWVESITKIINRRLSADGTEKQKQITYQSQPPPVEWHLTRQKEEFDLMTLHPVEIARQVTLLEFDLYRAVKPSELVGTVWIKKNKNITSPNLIKMIQHSTRFTFWLEKCIIEAENFEERVAVMTRILEIMCVFQDLNNFNGVLEVISALHSSAVFRLDHTFAEWQKNLKLKKCYEESQDLNQERFKRYIEKLRSIDPPCVPFLGIYLTNILLTEEGNPDFLPRAAEGMINFKKRRKVAEITGEIQQYQNQPYCLTPVSDIRAFFEELNPLDGVTDNQFSNYLFEKSQKMEPRNSKQPIKASRIREYTLKSPGIKTSSSRHGPSTMKSERNNPLSPSPSPLSQESGMDGDQVSMAGVSPPSLSPPNSPNPDSVFATVLISTASTSCPAPSPVALSVPAHPQTASATSAPAPPLPNFQPSPPKPVITQCAEDRPPPLPPRRGNTYSMSDLQPPERPPRGAPAPPLPPRSAQGHATLPRSISQPHASLSRSNTRLPSWSGIERDSRPNLRIHTWAEPDRDHARNQMWSEPDREPFVNQRAPIWTDPLNPGVQTRYVPEPQLRFLQSERDSRNHAAVQNMTEPDIDMRNNSTFQNWPDPERDRDVAGDHNHSSLRTPIWPEPPPLPPSPSYNISMNGENMDSSPALPPRTYKKEARSS